MARPLALCALLLGLAFGPGLSAQDPGSLAGTRELPRLVDIGPTHALVLKLRTEMEGDGLQRRESTGQAEVDALSAELGAAWVRKVFRDPPRGHLDPGAWERIGLGRWVHVEFEEERADLERVVERYLGLPSVEKAEGIHWVYPTVVPSDPDYAPRQWDLKADKCDAESAWDVITDASDVLVFVVDTGVEITHSDIAANLWTNPGEIPANGIDDEGNGFIDDVYGWDFVNDENTVEDDWPHGMHVSGTIGAVGNNANKVAGIAWGARLAHAKMFASGHGNDEYGAQATVYAADNGAQVTNNSWGDSFPSGPIQDAVEYADALDVLQVAAAGNKGNSNDHFPAVFPEMLAVASTNSSDQKSSWSSYGDWIDMCAPGEAIYNLWVGDSTATISGTSMASPHVAGAAALVRSVNPQLSNLEARWVLRHASDDLGPAGFDDSFGWGRLDLGQAVRTARSISLSTRSPVAGESVSVDLLMPQEAGMGYLMLAGASGILPGLALSGHDPGDARVFPLNMDFWVSWQLRVQPHPIARDFLGTLDGAGQASGTFVTLDHPLFVDQTFSVAALTFDPLDLSSLRFITAPLSFTIQP